MQMSSQRTQNCKSGLKCKPSLKKNNSVNVYWSTFCDFAHFNDSEAYCCDKNPQIITNLLSHVCETIKCTLRIKKTISVSLKFSYC